MLRNNTKWLVVVFVVLAGVAVYLQNSPAEVGATPTLAPLPDFLFDINPTELKEFKVMDAEGNAVSFKADEEGNWYIAEPEEYPVDRLDAARFFQGVSSLLDWTSLSDVSDLTTLDAIGLSEPGYQIILITEDREMTVHIGSETVTGNGYYVLIDEGLPKVIRRTDVDNVTGLLTVLPLLPEPTATIDLTNLPEELEQTPSLDNESEPAENPTP